eukprot:COSAG02_NODE_856_length_16468_cov_131.787831_11_plen_549_part_00
MTKRLDGDAAASEVVMACDEKTGEAAVIKAELNNAASTQVYHDRNVLDWLLKGRGQRECPLEPGWAPKLVGLPQLHSACKNSLIMHNRVDAATGTQLKMRMFAMEVLGPSLERVLRQCPGGLSPPAVRVVGCQLLDALEYIHSNGFLHCDIKPANFLLKNGSVVVVDFGIAKKYVCERPKAAQRNHPGPKYQHSNLPGTGEGTGEWKSCFAERCDPLGRRDDMEALGFVLLKLSCGELPWEEDAAEGAAPRPAMSQAEELKATKARLRQKDVQPSKLCAGIADPGLRKAVAAILTQARAMGAEDKPRYDAFRGLFKSAAAGDTKAGQVELRQLEADIGGAAPPGAAAVGASAAAGGRAPQKQSAAKKRAAAKSSPSAATAAAAQSMKSKRAASAKLLGRGSALGAGPLAAAATSGDRAGASAAPRRKAVAASKPASPQVKRASGRLSSQKSPGAIRKQKKTRQSTAPSKTRRHASPAGPAEATASRGSSGGTATDAVRAMSTLCAAAKGRVSAELRSEITAQMLRVQHLASMGDELAGSAVSLLSSRV